VHYSPAPTIQLAVSSHTGPANDDDQGCGTAVDSLAIADNREFRSQRDCLRHEVIQCNITNSAAGRA
jgi:hypothetical protein